MRNDLYIYIYIYLFKDIKFQSVSITGNLLRLAVKSYQKFQNNHVFIFFKRLRLRYGYFYNLC
jgi:hypothetical protein